MTHSKRMLSDAEQLALAVKIASEVHLKQFDKGGKPYILHPLHLMFELLYDMQLATIAILHDVLEDSDNPEELRIELERAGFSERVLTALDLMTHDPDEPYEDYIERLCGNFDTIRVKRKDLRHNSDITRLKGLREKDFKRLEKYQRAYVRLGEARKNFRVYQISQMNKTFLV